MAIQISGCPVIDNSRNLTNIANATSSAATANSFVLRDADGKICVNGVLGDVKLCSLGASGGGGFVICKSSGLIFIVSPYSAEVSRTWYCRDDANTTAQSASGSTGWFVPTITQLQNPGYCCRSFWGPSPCLSVSPNLVYWSSTEIAATNACSMYIANGSNTCVKAKTTTNCVRAFRCVTY